jgi:hypothetical protein
MQGTICSVPLVGMRNSSIVLSARSTIRVKENWGKGLGIPYKAVIYEEQKK